MGENKEAVFSLQKKKKWGQGSVSYPPISLLTGPYRIISKVLSNRLSEVLPDFTDGNQFASFKSSTFLDRVWIAKETVAD